MEDDYVEGLTGEEIIEDLLDQIANKLHGDCNLRATDSYTGGYDGWVEVHLNLHGLDKSTIKARITIGKDTDDPDAEMVDARVDIPVEPRLNVVRERSGQDVPTLAKNEEGKVVVKKRHYARHQPGGGAMGDSL